MSEITPLHISPEQLASAGGYITRNWGDHGYTIEEISSPTARVSIFRVRYTDGSRFAVAVDKWGNAHHVDTFETRNPPALKVMIAEMHARAVAN